MYSIFDNGNNMCSGQATGTYYTDVPTFVDAYVNQMQLDAKYTNTEYSTPTAASYLTCSLYKVNGQRVSEARWGSMRYSLLHC